MRPKCSLFPAQHHLFTSRDLIYAEKIIKVVFVCEDYAAEQKRASVITVCLSQRLFWTIIQNPIEKSQRLSDANLRLSLPKYVIPPPLYSLMIQYNNVMSIFYSTYLKYIYLITLTSICNIFNAVLVGVFL